jgi:hypothetical protein
MNRLVPALVLSLALAFSSAPLEAKNKPPKPGRTYRKNARKNQAKARKQTQQARRRAASRPRAN